MVLKKSSNLPIVGIAVAILMFGLAMCVGFGDELIRFAEEHQGFGILIPIGIGCVFVGSLLMVLRQSLKYKPRTLIAIGVLAVVAIVGVANVCIQSTRPISMSGEDRYRESALRIMEDEKRLQQITDEMQGQKERDAPKTSK